MQEARSAGVTATVSHAPHTRDPAKAFFVGSLMLAALASSVIHASGAGARERVWLANGTETRKAERVQLHGMLDLTDLNLIGIPTTIRCDVILDGTVGPGRFGSIEAALSQDGDPASQPSQAQSLALKCTALSGACIPGSPVEVTPDNLPWQTEVRFMAAGPELYKIFTRDHAKALLPGFQARCFTGLVTIVDQCTGKTSGELENMLSDLPTAALVLIVPSAPTLSERASCTFGGEAAGEILGELLLSSTHGSALAVSYG